MSRFPQRGPGCRPYSDAPDSFDQNSTVWPIPLAPNRPNAQVSGGGTPGFIPAGSTLSGNRFSPRGTLPIERDYFVITPIKMEIERDEDGLFHVRIGDRHDDGGLNFDEMLMRLQEIVCSTGICKSSILRSVRRMVAAGAVSKRGRGVYSLARTTGDLGHGK